MTLDVNSPEYDALMDVPPVGGPSRLDVNSPEHYALMEAFERTAKANPWRERLDRESRDYWPMGYFYALSETNNRFLAFRAGYELGRSKGEVGK